MRATITDVDQRFSLETQSFSNYLTFELPSGRRFQVSVDDEIVSAVIAESQGVPLESPDDIVSTSKITGQTTTRAQAEKDWAEAFANPQQARANAERLGLPRRPDAAQREFESEQFETEIAPFLPNGSNGHGQFSVITPADPVTLLELDDTGPQHTPVGDWPERELKHHVEEGMVDWQTLPDTQLPPSVKAVLRASQIAPLIMMSDLNTLKAEIITHMAQRPRAGKTDWNSGPKRQIESAPRRTVARDEAGNPIPPGGILEMPERDPGEIRGDDEDVQQA